MSVADFSRAAFKHERQTWREVLWCPTLASNVAYRRAHLRVRVLRPCSVPDAVVVEYRQGLFFWKHLCFVNARSSIHGASLSLERSVAIAFVDKLVREGWSLSATRSAFLSGICLSCHASLARSKCNRHCATCWENIVEFLGLMQEF